MVPEEWVAAATAAQVSTGRDPEKDWGQGYGYQFWGCRGGNFRGDGAFGQYCIVLPKHDAVIAITSGVKDMQAVLNLVWDKLVPAFEANALTPDADSEKRLKDRLASLSLPTPQGSASSEMLGFIHKKWFAFEKNPQDLEAISLEKASDGGIVLVMKSNGTEQRLACGYGEWKRSKLKLGAVPEQPVALCGAWKSESEYNVKLCRVETPFVTSLRLQFKGNELLYDSDSNVGFGQTKQPQLVGHTPAGANGR